MFDALLDALEKELQAALDTAVQGLVAMVRTRLEGAVAYVAKERAKGLAEVAEERTKSLAEVDARSEELGREVAAMQKHKEAQQGRVELNIGGYRFETSVQTLRRVPHTFFDAYFSGRYAQDVCADGGIFVDRDGEHFGHVLEYMRDGHVSVAEAGARPNASLLRALKREFGFYCFELHVKEPAEPEQLVTAYVMGGEDDNDILASMERYDNISGTWVAVAAMSTPRESFGACVVARELYVVGGRDSNNTFLSSVEKCSPSNDTWSAVAPLRTARAGHAAVAVGSAMYVLGGLTYGIVRNIASASVLKFDSIQGTWSEVAPMPHARFAHAACVSGSDIYVFGGCDANIYQYGSVLKYNTIADAWTTLAPMPSLCMYHDAITLDGQIYIMGMGDNEGEAFLFDPDSGVWSNLAPTLSSKSQGSFFVLDGRVYAAGGDANSSSVERYDVGADAWMAVADLLKGRRQFGAVTITAAGPAEEQNLFDALIAKATR
jgi:hypothetical protein